MASPNQVPVTFTYQRSGLLPPLFVIGSFSTPPWTLEEMDSVADQHGEYVFTKHVMADEGTVIQYKFRHPGEDWWGLDPNAETYTDEGGNVNSMVRAVAKEVEQEVEQATLPEQDNNTENEASSDQVVPSHATETPVATTESQDNEDATEANHESPEEVAEETEVEGQSPTPVEETASNTAEVADSAVHPDSDEPGSDDADNACPMLSHECLDVTSNKPSENEAPLSTHDDVDHSSEAVGPSDTIDYDDPRLEHFPSDRGSIMAAMRRLSSTVEADHAVVSDSNSSSQNESSFDEDDASTSHSQSTDTSRHPTDTVTSTNSLTSISEGDEPLNEEVTLDHATTSKAPVQFVGPAHKNSISMSSICSNEDEGIAMSVTPRGRDHKILETKTTEESQTEVDETNTIHVPPTEEQPADNADDVSSNHVAPTEEQPRDTKDEINASHVPLAEEHSGDNVDEVEPEHVPQTEEHPTHNVEVEQEHVPQTEEHHENTVDETTKDHVVLTEEHLVHNADEVHKDQVVLTEEHPVHNTDEVHKDHVALTEEHTDDNVDDVHKDHVPLTEEHADDNSSSPDATNGLSSQKSAEQPAIYPGHPKKQNDGWLRAFISTVFVDWIGYVGRLCGRGSHQGSPSSSAGPMIGALFVVVVSISLWTMQDSFPSVVSQLTQYGMRLKDAAIPF